MKKTQLADQNLIIEGKVFAILSYLSIFCIIPLVFKKDNKFALVHGKQGLVIFIAEVAVFIAHIVLGMWILRLGTFLLGVMSLIGIFHAVQGCYVRLFFVSDIAEKIIL